MRDESLPKKACFNRIPRLQDVMNAIYFICQIVKELAGQVGQPLELSEESSGSILSNPDD
ncbi:hypothetical protein DSM3645_25051 [Blastopirellula marina DSM 3645]|uniref:Uncharacterized protein n=1 Tax=Blastopirellula marina DSM 3645 TaxID=314230 RepID=A4A2D6_9BACT|nr:hypothetical protein DSM3645_25051 [Blastopirellula marina DSM 3645]